MEHRNSSIYNFSLKLCRLVKSVYLSLNTGTDGVNCPSSCVVIVEVHFPKAQTWMPLFCSIKEAVVNCNANTAVTHVLWIGPYEHCLIVFTEMTSDIGMIHC
jgi:hypothetical protein